MRQLFTMAATTALLAGCAVGPDYEQPRVDLPDEWPEHELFATTADEDWQQWWSHFDDPVLDGLVDRALDDNLDVLLQAERVMEAHARLGLADAERMPTVKAQAEASRERQPEATVPFPDAAGTSSLFSVSGMLGYELDLWGRLASQRDAAEAHAAGVGVQPGRRAAECGCRGGDHLHQLARCPGAAVAHGIDVGIPAAFP